MMEKLVNNMKKNHKLCIMLGVLFTFLIIIPCVRYGILLKKSSHDFVTGLNSKYCYNEGNENKNIRIKIYYGSLIECAKPLKK